MRSWGMCLRACFLRSFMQTAQMSDLIWTLGATRDGVELVFRSCYIFIWLALELQVSAPSPGPKVSLCNSVFSPAALWSGKDPMEICCVQTDWGSFQSCSGVCTGVWRHHVLPPFLFRQQSAANGHISRVFAKEIEQNSARQIFPLHNNAHG